MGAGDGGRRPVLPPFRAIADASALIALRQLGLLDRGGPVFAECLVPSAVEREVTPSGGLPAWVTRRTEHIKVADVVVRARLDRGESEVISLGLGLGDRVVVLDDHDARVLALELGLDVVGTRGLLVAAKRRGIIPLVGPYLDRLPTIRFRASPDLLAHVREAAGEAPDL